MPPLDYFINHGRLPRFRGLLSEILKCMQMLRVLQDKGQSTGLKVDIHLPGVICWEDFIRGYINHLNFSVRGIFGFFFGCFVGIVSSRNIIPSDLNCADKVITYFSVGMKQVCFLRLKIGLLPLTFGYRHKSRPYIPEELKLGNQDSAEMIFIIKKISLYQNIAQQSLHFLVDLSTFSLQSGCFLIFC